MKQDSLLKILFFVTFLTVLTGILLAVLESNLPIIFMIIASIIYTLCIATIMAFDNKYLLAKSGLWITNLQVPAPEYDHNLIDFNNHLHKLNLETQKSLDESRLIALELETIKDKVQTKFIGALTTKRVHDYACRFARQIKEANRINFKFERDAKKQGFVPCKCLN